MTTQQPGDVVERDLREYCDNAIGWLPVAAENAIALIQSQAVDLSLAKDEIARCHAELARLRAAQ